VWRVDRRRTIIDGHPTCFLHTHIQSIDHANPNPRCCMSPLTWRRLVPPRAPRRRRRRPARRSQRQQRQQQRRDVACGGGGGGGGGRNGPGGRHRWRLGVVAAAFSMWSIGRSIGRWAARFYLLWLPLLLPPPSSSSSSSCCCCNGRPTAAVRHDDAASDRSDRSINRSIDDSTLPPAALYAYVSMCVRCMLSRSIDRSIPINFASWWARPNMSERAVG
jgi:hypothetical protein